MSQYNIQTIRCSTSKISHVDDNDDNNNDNILFDHNIQIEIIMYNSLENQIINWSTDYY